MVSQGRCRTAETHSDDAVSHTGDDAYNDECLSGATTVLAKLGTSKREEQMSALVQKKLQIMDSKRWRIQLGNKSIGVSEQIDKVITIVLFAKDFVSSAVSADPHAALAWAGVCVLLPVSRLAPSFCAFVPLPSLSLL
jgi:N-terminal domain of NWD NACHT-NTPase